jgi:hypothetical protein
VARTPSSAAGLISAAAGPPIRLSWPSPPIRVRGASPRRPAPSSGPRASSRRESAERWDRYGPGTEPPSDDRIARRINRGCFGGVLEKLKVRGLSGQSSTTPPASGRRGSLEIGLLADFRFDVRLTRQALRGVRRGSRS